MFDHKKKIFTRSKVYSKSLNSSSFPKISFAKNQTTISKDVVFKGVGLHSGKMVTMILKPSNKTGILFRIKSKNTTFTEILANYKNVTNTFLCTTLSDSNGNKISTTEHILAAIQALGIDNLIIELDSNEVPIMDGSCKNFIESIKKVNVVQQRSFKKFIKVKKTISVVDGDSCAKVTPEDETIISCKLSFKSQVIGNQSISFVLTPKIFESEICNARTFGFLNDISVLREKGLTLGGSLDNAIVISKDRILNVDGLRYNDEFVRHKALDFIGDLSLAGHQMIGSFLSYKGGHKINCLLLNKIFSDKKNWEYVDSNLNPIF